MPRIENTAVFGGGSKRLVKIGTVKFPDYGGFSTNIDCKKLSDYQELTTADFVLDYVRYFSDKGYGQYNGHISKSYNPSNGLLTVSKSTEYSGGSWQECDVYALSSHQE